MKRLPDRSLNQFLRQLKKDVISNATYIRMLRLNTKFIKACNCENLQVHSYCITVQVLQDSRIFCRKCDGHYNLHVFNHSLLNNIRTIFYKWLASLLLICAMVILFTLLDASIKDTNFD